MKKNFEIPKRSIYSRSFLFKKIQKLNQELKNLVIEFYVIMIPKNFIRC